MQQTMQLEEESSQGLSRVEQMVERLFPKDEIGGSIESLGHLPSDMSFTEKKNLSKEQKTQNNQLLIQTRFAELLSTNKQMIDNIKTCKAVVMRKPKVTKGRISMPISPQQSIGVATPKDTSQRSSVFFSPRNLASNRFTKKVTASFMPPIAKQGTQKMRSDLLQEATDAVVNYLQALAG